MHQLMAQLHKSGKYSIGFRAWGHCTEVPLGPVLIRTRAATLHSKVMGSQTYGPLERLMTLLKFWYIMV